MQDQAIVEIGKLKLRGMGNKKPYEFFIENMFPKKENYDMLVLRFKVMNTENVLSIVYDSIDIEKASEKNYLKYAYRKGSSRGGDITFTTKTGDVHKKFKTLLEQQLPKIAAANSGDSFYFELLLNFLKDESNFKKVVAELSNVYASLPKDQQNASGFTFCFTINGEDKYLSDFEIIQEILNGSGTIEKSKKYDVISEGHEQLCSICFEQKPIVHGFASPFKYATVDKPGMVSGFFNQATNWKNYPICTDCSLEFELGKNYVYNKLSKYFYGKSYFAIPKTLLKKDNNNLERALRLIENLYDSDISQEKTRKDEDRIWKLIGNENDFFNLNLLFHERDSKTDAIKIKLLLEEIVPSRFRLLFIDTPKQINGHELYKKATFIKKEPADLTFHFGLLKDFFKDDFYGIVQRVFMLEKMDTEILYGRFMQLLRSNRNKSKTSDTYINLKLDILKAHMVMSYLQALSILDYNQNYPFMEKTIEAKAEKGKSFDMYKLQAFVKDNPGFLDTDYKVGIFSVGILVRLLMNIQQAELGNTPFENKLKGYNINHESLKSIYKEALLKLNQYKGFYAYNDFKDFVAQYFVLNAHALPKMSNNEISFYFIAGVQFGSQFRTDKEEKTQTINE
ncbi:TIGR02556 family CRISPR-associated protein [Marinilongibacter aquaticus]|uniref:TIGR02556 family CRISPR-associated protein n=1 Tax=Marinilongibacter aquaticus TaxID=2975157 RepID=UPI0021BD255E|nr:TIGR02556 family CRISPR-associated protein [Marinilongibacter aquaticus]UBM60786.1 TIGR02556 family CRISPR-associated protein [Marinilongibacter aquaticus]